LSSIAEGANTQEDVEMLDKNASSSAAAASSSATPTQTPTPTPDLDPRNLVPAGVAFAEQPGQGEAAKGEGKGEGKGRGNGAITSKWGRGPEGETASEAEEIFPFASTWPTVKCSVCDMTGVWRRMQESWRWVDEKASKWAKTYRCAPCVAKALKVTEQAATRFIMETRPGFEDKVRRSDKFEEERKKVREQFPAITGKKEIRKLTKDLIAEVLSPIAEIIAKKCKVMALRSSKVQHHRDLAERLEACTTMAGAQAVIAEMEAIEDEIDALSKPLAFGHMDDATAARMNCVAQYSDEFCSTYTADGKLVSALRAFYICLAGGSQWPCASLILSKHWARKFEDIGASKQKWRCTVCSANYKTRFGQLVELITRSGTFYFLADIPRDWDDVRAMWVESCNPNAQSPDQLWAAIKDIHPQKSQILRPATAADMHSGGDPYGVYKILALPELQACPRFSWDQLVHFGKVL
jgi:hypothetical protein